ncbi:long-chain fatty acid--CoA ligase [Fodinicola feengrottensis]|uniref:Long-chain fatty acid--CoA ligase n=1 Tax=Fodinicola feengrottensis TaxID=435914 RepID=A0ABP4UQ93_9ACTN
MTEGLVLAELRRWATERPDASALDDGRRTVTWSELWEWVAGGAAELRGRGVRAGDRLALDGVDPVGTVAWFLAADWCGAAALVCDPAWSAAETKHILAAARPTHHVETSRTPRFGSDLSLADDENVEFYLGTTSGSTGGPKVFGRTRRSWHESYPVFTDVTGMTVDDTVLSGGRLSTSGGIFAVTHAISVGARCLLLPDWSPAKAAARAAEATVAHLIPAMLAALVPVWEVEPAAHLRMILTVGAKLDRDLEIRAEKALPGCQVVEYYGSSEQSVVSVRTTEPAATVGRPPSTVDIEIRDDGGQPVGAAEEGEIWVRSALLFAGYLTNGVRVDAGEWVSVGDRGLLREDGSLVVVGRGAATVVSGGTKVSAEEVEAVLRAAPGVAEAVVVALPHPWLGAVVAAVLQPEPGTVLHRRALRAHTAVRLSAGKRPRRWFTVDRIPLTTSGKIARAAVQDRWPDVRPLR